MGKVCHFGFALLASVGELCFKLDKGMGGTALSGWDTMAILFNSTEFELTLPEPQREDDKAWMYKVLTGGVVSSSPRFSANTVWSTEDALLRCPA